MRTLKLVGAQTFSSPTRGVIAVQLGKTCTVHDDTHAEELLALSYIDGRGQEIPYFTENLDAPTLFRRKAVTLSMMELINQKSGDKATGGVRKSRARKAQ